MIDEARTPLIISGPVPHADNSKFQEIKPWIEQLVRAQQQLVASYLSEAEKILKTKPGDFDAGLALLRVKRGQPKNTRYIKTLSQQGIGKLIQTTENEYLKDNSSRMDEVDNELYFAVDEKGGTIDLTDKGREFLSKLSIRTAIFSSSPMSALKLPLLRVMPRLLRQKRSRKKMKSIACLPSAQTAAQYQSAPESLLALPAR